MKVTPWFPPEIKPVHVGPYQCKICVSNGYAQRSTHYWDGKEWWTRKGGEVTPALFGWRGLAEKP